ncbi:MAG: hypothetical protein Q7T80_09190, partial [Methanoregula sp.]|nr:hypothetical protein [Methanoregula sp.]
MIAEWKICGHSGLWNAGCFFPIPGLQILSERSSHNHFFEHRSYKRKFPIARIPIGYWKSMKKKIPAVIVLAHRLMLTNKFIFFRINLKFFISVLADRTPHSFPTGGP